ncbi:MAG TPA: DUF3822 family protein [Bacteroidia bacterium]|jgi:hypothetical protein|nr:DUF3822 family protein [Bacteroidia bacterium]
MSIATIKVPGTTVEKLTEENFPLKNRRIHLSVEVREKQLLAALLDKHSNQYIAWASFPITETEPIINSLKDEFLSTSTSSTSVVFTPNSSILVPALYFKKESVRNYLETQQLNKADECPCYDYIKNLDSYNLYTVSKNISVLQEKYPNAVFRHHTSIFLEYILIENKISKEDKVHVSIFTNYMDIAVLKEGKLILSNRYYFENGSDFIYNLLWVYEQMELNAEKVTCIFYGEVEKASEIFKLSSRYIKNVQLGQRNEQSAYSIPLNSLSAHKYRSLFTQYLCV